MNNFLMTDDLIVRQLKEKELRLVAELNKVRLALNAFVNGEHQGAGSGERPGLIPDEYSDQMTYSNKILFVLSSRQEAMLVSEIVDAIHILEPALDKEKLHNNVSYNLSMLAKYAKVRKHPFNRKVKYSL